MPAQRIRVATQHSISICRGVIFDLQCFVNGFQKSLVDVFCPADFTLVSCLGKKAQKAIRHTQGCCGHCFIVHGLSLVCGRPWPWLILIRLTARNNRVTLTARNRASQADALVLIRLKTLLVLQVSLIVVKITHFHCAVLFAIAPAQAAA